MADFESLVNAILLHPEIANAESFIALIPNTTPGRFLCLGNTQEIIEGTSEICADDSVT